MEITGKYRIEANRETVWAALNDPEVLGAAIPGCEKIDKISDSAFTATMKLKIGPVSVKLAVSFTLEDVVPPESYTIVGAGKGGPAGYAKGSAKVRLDEDSPATLLSYEVDVAVFGKLGQVGARVIGITAKKLADEFFRRFSEQIGEGARQPALPPQGAGIGYWVLGVVSAALILLGLFLTYG